MDNDVLKLLKFLYDHRTEWFTQYDFIRAGFALTPPDYQWLVDNKILSSVGTNPMQYRITLGGIMEYTRYIETVSDARFNKRIAITALLVSVASLVVSLLSP